MAEETRKAPGIEKYDGTDFAYWRMQIEDYLYGRKLHLPILRTKPESMKVEEWALLDRQVLRIQSSFNLLLGHPWIHEASSIPFSLHQKVKFIHKGRIITI